MVNSLFRLEDINTPLGKRHQGGECIDIHLLNTNLLASHQVVQVLRQRSLLQGSWAHCSSEDWVYQSLHFSEHLNSL